MPSLFFRNSIDFELEREGDKKVEQKINPKWGDFNTKTLKPGF